MLTIAGKPVAQVKHGLRHLVVSPPAAVTLDQCRRRLAEGAGMDLHRQSLDAAIFIELYGEDDSAAAGRGSKLGAAVLPVEIARPTKRGGEPQDLGGVGGFFHK